MILEVASVPFPVKGARREKIEMRILLIAAFAAAGWAQTARYDDAEWQNPEIFGINKLAPRNSSWPNPDAASGWISDYTTSPCLSFRGEAVC